MRMRFAPPFILKQGGVESSLIYLSDHKKRLFGESADSKTEDSQENSENIYYISYKTDKSY